MARPFRLFPMRSYDYNQIGCLATLLACLGILLLGWGGSALAGTISFEIELRNSRYVATNRGDSAAYYPALFRLDRNGQWQALQSDSRPVELWYNGSLSAPAPVTPKQGVEQAEAVMVSFFDQTGITMSQIVLLGHLQEARPGLAGEYKGSGVLLNAPPQNSNIRGTWLLIPWSRGITALLKPQSFAHTPPPALRVSWQEKKRARLDTGTHLPDLLLLHETDQGLRLQRLSNSGARVPEQRCAWLNMHKIWYLLAGLCALGGLLTALQGWRKRGES